jgi:cytochrome c oxidase subunit 1
MWEGLTYASALGGLILFASAMFFVLVMVFTLVAGKRTEPSEIEWAEPLGERSTKPLIWDRLGLWFVVAVILVILAYAIPLSDIFGMTRYGSPGFKPF